MSKYWPEFGLNGKENIRIVDVLRHESGLAWFTTSIPSIRDAWKDNIKRNKIGKIIEDEPLHFPTYEYLDSQSEFHTVTRGLIVNEIVRRIDPKVRFLSTFCLHLSAVCFQGRTLGEILNEDIDIDGINLGIKVDEYYTQALESIKPKDKPNFFKRCFATLKTKCSKPEVQKLNKNLQHVLKGNDGKPPVFHDLKAKDLESLQQNSSFIQAQVSGLNVQANARGCAELASLMACQGFPLMSYDTWKEIHSTPKMGILNAEGEIVRSNFTKGGINSFEKMEYVSKLEALHMFKNREGYFGWFGFGGSILMWHPVLKIGFAFVPTQLNTHDFFNTKGAILQQLVKESALAAMRKQQQGLPNVPIRSKYGVLKL